MSLLAIEIADAGLIALSEARAKPGAASPGFARIEGDALVTGSRARARARLEPRRTHTRFWDPLDDAPLGRPFPDGMTRADLAHAHLAALWNAQPPGVDGVLLAVPGHHSPAELGLLLGIARAAGIPVAGLVDAGLAASASLAAGGDATVLHVDVLLHRAVVSEIAAGARLARRRVDGADGAGLMALDEAWARGIARAFVAQTRFDPFHAAETEQRLFDLLPRFVEQLTREDSARLLLEAGGREHVAELTRPELLGFGESVVERVHRMVGSAMRAGAAATLALSPRAARIPDLAERLSELGDVAVHVLEPGAAARGALAAVEAIRSDAEALPFVVELPRPEGAPRTAPTSVATRARERVGRRPTHVLHAGVAHAIDGEPLVVGSAAAAPGRGLSLKGAGVGISRSHCTLRREGERIVVEDHSSYGTFLNGARVHGRATLLAGDRLRVGSPGVELQLIAVIRG